ncbi:hypothetical protein KEM52_002401 [Ascosphaera acerosa]|nr:hypothetical protein KEM52_002401 [Ascosphaera acerosa]
MASAADNDNATIAQWLLDARGAGAHSPAAAADANTISSDLLLFCWAHVSCETCLDASPDCSWCATSATCIPNHSSFPLLEPLLKPDICPLGARERWELRAQPLGCPVSTMTLLASVSAALSTVALGVFVALLFWAVSAAVRSCLLGRDVLDQRRLGYRYAPPPVVYDQDMRWETGYGGPEERRYRRAVVRGGRPLQNGSISAMAMLSTLL